MSEPIDFAEHGRDRDGVAEQLNETPRSPTPPALSLHPRVILRSQPTPSARPGTPGHA
jgi:hypothetical protein